MPDARQAIEALRRAAAREEEYAVQSKVSKDHISAAIHWGILNALERVAHEMERGDA
jgi:Cdc6-like AAA superfamily ATPase